MNASQYLEIYFACNTDHRFSWCKLHDYYLCYYSNSTPRLCSPHKKKKKRRKRLHNTSTRQSRISQTAERRKNVSKQRSFKLARMIIPWGGELYTCVMKPFRFFVLFQDLTFSPTSLFCDKTKTPRQMFPVERKMRAFQPSVCILLVGRRVCMFIFWLASFHPLILWVRFCYCVRCGRGDCGWIWKIRESMQNEGVLHCYAFTFVRVNIVGSVTCFSTTIW